VVARPDLEDLEDGRGVATDPDVVLQFQSSVPNGEFQDETINSKSKALSGSATLKKRSIGPAPSVAAASSGRRPSCSKPAWIGCTTKGSE